MTVIFTSVLNWSMRTKTSLPGFLVMQISISQSLCWRYPANQKPEVSRYEIASSQTSWATHTLNQKDLF